MRKFFFKRRRERKQNRRLIVFPAIFVFSVGVCFAQVTTPTATPSITNPQSADTTSPVTRDQAIQMTLAQVSTYNQTQLNERLAAEDIRQSRAALLPRITANPTVIYTSPSLARQESGLPRSPSFLGANAITEYQGLVTAAGRD